jgi:hypothetical protein
VQVGNFYFLAVGLFIAGSIFAVYSEVGIVALCIIFFASVFQFLDLERIKRFSSLIAVKRIDILLILVVILHILLSFQVLNPWKEFEKLFSILVMWLLGYVLTKNLKYFGYGMLLGSIFICIFIYFPRFKSFFDQELYWQDNPKHAIRTEIGDFSRFQPVEKESAWVIHNFSAQGPGKVRYQFEIRSDKVFKINACFRHPGLPGGRSIQMCNVQLDWNQCFLEVELPTRDWVTVGIGGLSTWNNHAPSIEVKNARLIAKESPTLVDVLTNPSRVSGFAFNENAFGVHITVVGLLISAILPLQYGLLLLPLMMSAVFLSGSRGALLAFTFGLLVLIFVRSRFYKVLPWFIVMVFTVAVSLLLLRNTTKPSIAQSQPIALSMRIFENDFARDRIDIWRLATKAWLENPRTFLIGTGDLSAAMLRQFDPKTSGVVLSSEGLTHAHNLWLQTAGESGLLGLSIMLWLWGWVVLKAWRSRDSGALALLTAIFVINSVDYLFFYAPVHLCFWMAAASFKKQPEDSVQDTPVKLETL